MTAPHLQVDRAKVLSNTIKQKRKEKAGKWEVPLPKVRPIAEDEMFKVLKSGKRMKKSWKRMITKVGASQQGTCVCHVSIMWATSEFALSRSMPMARIGKYESNRMLPWHGSSVSLRPSAGLRDFNTPHMVSHPGCPCLHMRLAPWSIGMRCSEAAANRHCVHLCR